MIDFIIAFFYFADDLGLVKIEQIITINLITLLVIRGFYIIVYLLTYHKMTERAKSFTFSKKELIYFGIKQVSVEFAEDDIDLWSTAYRFNTGHKVRIAISSSNYPRFGVNPNTGEPPRAYSYQYLQRFIANNTILVGPDYPSYITLPTPI